MPTDTYSPFKFTYPRIVSRVLDLYATRLKDVVQFFENMRAGEDHTSESTHVRFINKYTKETEELQEIRSFLLNAEDELISNNPLYHHLLDLVINNYKTATHVLINSTQGQIDELQRDDENSRQVIADHKSEIIDYNAELVNFNTYLKMLESEKENLVEFELNKLSNGYQKSWNLAEKSKFILTAAKTVLTLPQILDKILSYEPELANNKVEKRRIQANLAGTLKFYIDKNIFKRTQTIQDNAHYLYGLYDWFDHDDKVLHEYLPKT